jgi:hypothetical protein
MNSMMAQWEEERRIMNDWMAAQDQVIVDLKKIIESLASNAAMSNTSAAQDTKSPSVMGARYSATSQLG